ncbi:MAG: hypothetical protein ACRDYE_00640 [Acidimicrobiales bacterium]
MRDSAGHGSPSPADRPTTTSLVCGPPGVRPVQHLDQVLDCGEDHKSIDLSALTKDQRQCT